MERFKKLGFFCVEPSNKDKTYYFVKHIEKGNHTLQVWITLKKVPLVTYKYDHKLSALTKILEDTIGSFLGDLGYESYTVEE